MTSILGRIATATVIATLVSTGLTGCGLLDGSSRLEEALEYLPADATAVTFVDRAAVAERLDLDDIETGASEDDLERWSRKQAEEGYGTELAQWTIAMQDAAFSEFDVEWEATATAEDELVRVWKLDDDLDFDEVADDLADAGYERSGDKDAPVFQAELSAAGTSGLFGDRYPGFLLRIALVPDEHVMITGNVETGLDVVADDEDSLADEGSFEDLAGAAPDQDGLEYAAMTVDPRCGGLRLTPEQVEATLGDLGHPDDGIAYFARPDDRLTVVRLFEDHDAAADDADGLDSYLEDVAPQTGLDVDFDVEQDDDTVTVEADFDDRHQVTTAWQRAEGPFACSPG